ncbi:MAG: MFS transporter [Caldilineaceae bacterium]|nr:MFS transporter [Caldilineaceae bacterium]
MDNSTTRSIVLSLYLPTFVLAFATGMLTPIMPLYARSFEISYALVGLVLAAQGTGNLIGDIPAGIVLGKLGHKMTMLAGVSLYGLSITAMSFARTVPELIIFGLLAGIGNALWNISRHAYLADAAPSAGRGKAIAVFGGINRIGTFAGPLLGGALGAAFGLRVPFFLYAAVGAIALFFPLRFVERRGYRPPERGTMKEHFALTGAMIREHFRSLTTAGSGQLFAQMIRSGRNIVIPLYAADVLGLSVDQVGLVVGVAAAVDMSLFFVAGYVMDRFGRKFAYVPSFAIQGIGMALVPFTAGFGSLMVASSIIGLGNGLGSGTMMTLGADLAPVESRGEFLGVWRLIGDGGSAGGPMVVGAVADLLGLSLATFTIAGVGLLAAAMLGTLVPETLQKKIV